jgi:4-hydroxy-tetrahydrodipicolinate synthase
MLKLHGTGVALITPFDQNGQIDFPAFKRLIDHVTEGGVDYLVVAGTTGESATLTKEEKKQVLKAALEYNANRLPIVYGIGGNNTQGILDEIASTDLSKVTAILSVSPYYNKPSQAGIIAHYQKIADHSPVPVILYNVPGRTMSNMTWQTTIELSKHRNIIGMKEASSDMSQCMRIASKMPEGFLLISGDDILTPAMRVMGGVGVISVLANAYPTLFKTISHAPLAEAEAAASKILDINPLMYEEANPVGVKALLNLMGLCNDSVRLPLLPASEDLKKRIQKRML